MSWKLIDRPKTQKVTAKLAKSFAEMDPAPHDRPLSERRLQVYQRLLAAGEFRPVTWASALCLETGGVYRVNGKHTSTLLSGCDPMPEFYVTVEEYECDTLEDVAKLYATFDSKMMSRTARDINASFAACVPELAPLSPYNVSTAVSGMAYCLWGEEAYSHQPAERAELMLEYPEFVLWINGYVGSKNKPLNRAAVAAAMFATWRKSRSAATEFWNAVREETGTSPDLPDRKLAKWLGQSGVNYGKGAARVKKVGNREFYVKCLHAWNAWRRGETTNLNYYADKKVPAVQ